MDRRSWFVLLAAAVLFSWLLGGHDLWAPDEPYFAEGAREMLVDGAWLVPHVNGVVTTDKPPLFFWLIALVSAPFGAVLPLTARLPSALAALGTVLLTMRLGRRIEGPRTGALAGLVLATSFLFWDKARWAQIDSLLCFLIWGALSAFEAYRAGEASGRRTGLLFWLAAAAAVLAKGPVGLLLPLGIALVTLAWDRDLGRWRGFAPWLGPILFLTAVAAWSLPATLAGPDYNVFGALREHFVERGMHGMHHRQPFWYYLEVLPVLLLPWSALVPAFLVSAFRRRDRHDRLLLTAFLFVVVFFSISTEKRDLYVLPAFPAAALLTARVIGGLRGWEGAPANVGRRLVTFAQGLTGGVLAFVGIALPFVARTFDGVPAWVAVVLGAAFLAGGAATLALALAGRGFAAALASAAGMAAVYLAIVTVVYPVFEPQKSSRAFSLRLKEVTAESRAAGHEVVAYRLSNLPEAFAFYTDGVYTVETNDPDVLARHLARDSEVFAAVDEQGLPELPEEIRSRIVILDRTRLNSRNVALISNRGEAP